MRVINTNVLSFTKLFWKTFQKERKYCLIPCSVVITVVVVVANVVVVDDVEIGVVVAVDEIYYSQ